MNTTCIPPAYHLHTTCIPPTYHMHTTDIPDLRGLVLAVPLCLSSEGLVSLLSFKLASFSLVSILNFPILDSIFDGGGGGSRGSSAGDLSRARRARGWALWHTATGSLRAPLDRRSRFRSRRVGGGERRRAHDGDGVRGGAATTMARCWLSPRRWRRRWRTHGRLHSSFFSSSLLSSSLLRRRRAAVATVAAAGRR